jgi:hypothetical protein
MSRPEQFDGLILGGGKSGKLNDEGAGLGLSLEGIRAADVARARAQ